MILLAWGGGLIGVRARSSDTRSAAKTGSKKLFRPLSFYSPHGCIRGSQDAGYLRLL
jgi:hypothetical protein